MKFSLTDEQYTYYTNFIKSLGVGANRKTRRNLARIANKFCPPRTHVDLKPKEKDTVIGLSLTGLAALKGMKTEGSTEDQLKHRDKVISVLEDVLEKLT